MPLSFFQVTRCAQATSDVETDKDVSSGVMMPALIRFRFLSLKLSETAVLNSTTATTALSEVYHLDASSLPPNMLTFWQQRSATYNLLFPVAQDLLCAPASQAFVEMIFSIGGVCAAVVAAACRSPWKCVHVLN